MTHLNLVEIAGSHGQLTVDLRTGAIVGTTAGCEDGCDECGYQKGRQAYPYITRFDPTTFSTHSDILHVGYWYEEGGQEDYEPPLPIEVERP